MTISSVLICYLPQAKKELKTKQMGKGKRNRRRRKPNAPKKESIEHSPKKIPQSPSLLEIKSPKGILGFYVEKILNHPLATGISLLSAVVSLVFAYFALQSEVLIDTQSNTAITNPFDQEFKFSNQSLLSIHDVGFHFELVDVNHENNGRRFPGMIGYLSDPIRIIGPHENRSARISYFPNLQDKVISGELDVSIIYRPSLWPLLVSITRRFSLIKNSNGTFAWFANGRPEKNFVPSEIASFPTDKIILHPPDGTVILDDPR